MPTTKTKIVNKDWLDRRIEELNDWLFENKDNRKEYREKEHQRNYYVSKLIELEENNYKLIQL
jgi:hypothetical protein